MNALAHTPMEDKQFYPTPDAVAGKMRQKRTEVDEYEH